MRAIFEKETLEPKQYKIPEDFDHKKVETRIKKLINQVRENPLRYLATLRRIWPDIYFYIHVKAQEIVEGLLEKAEIDFNSYEDILSQLFALGLVENLDTRFWCNNCSEPIVLRSESNLGPRSLKLRCMKCGKKIAICSIYRLDNFLWKLIFSRDGLLGVTVAWLLKRRKIEYESPFFVKETELDFICNTPNGKVLLECKMHRSPPTDRSVRQKLVDDLKQMREHASIFEKESKEKIHESYLIYNFDLGDYQDLVEEEMNNYRGIHVIDFTQLDEIVAFISTIKQFVTFVKENAREKPTIHDFFKEWPWVLDPTWTQWNDEVHFSQLSRENFPDDRLDEPDRRIDFVCIGAGDTVHVLELKRPGHKINADDLEQLLHYVAFVRRRLDNVPERGYRDASGYIIGGEVSQDELTDLFHSNLT